eukprot:746284-Hanusia_phi.AAC.4
MHARCRVELRCFILLVSVHCFVVAVDHRWQSLDPALWKEHGDSRIAEIEIVDAAYSHVILPLSSLFDRNEVFSAGETGQLMQDLRSIHFFQVFLSFTGCSELQCKPLVSRRRVWLSIDASEAGEGVPHSVHTSSELVLHTSVCARSKVWYLKIHRDDVWKEFSRTFMRVIVSAHAALGVGGSDVVFVQQSSVLFAVPLRGSSDRSTFRVHVRVSEMQEDVPVLQSKAIGSVRVKMVGIQPDCPVTQPHESEPVELAGIRDGAGEIRLNDMVSLNATARVTWYMLLMYQPHDEEQGRVHINAEVFLDAQRYDYTSYQGSQCLLDHNSYNQLAALTGAASQLQSLACQKMHLLFPRRSFPYFLLAGQAGREGRERKRWRHVQQACKLASIELGDLYAMMAIVASESSSGSLTTTAIDKMQSFAASVLLRASRSASKEGKLELARELAERACEVRGEVEDLDELAYVQMKLGKFSAAEKSYRLLLLRHPSAAAHFALGAALWADKRNVTGAIREFRVGLQLDPDNAEMHVKMGMMMEEEEEEEGERGETACDHYSRAVQVQEDHLLARFLLGRCLNRQGKLVESARHYRHLLQRHQGHCEARYNLIEIMHNALMFEGREEHEKNAVSCIQQQLQRDGISTIHPLQSLQFAPLPLVLEIIDANNRFLARSRFPQVRLCCCQCTPGHLMPSCSAGS